MPLQSGPLNRACRIGHPGSSGLCSEGRSVLNVPERRNLAACFFPVQVEILQVFRLGRLRIPEVRPDQVTIDLPELRQDRGFPDIPELKVSQIIREIFPVDRIKPLEFCQNLHDPEWFGTIYSAFVFR